MRIHIKDRGFINFFILGYEFPEDRDDFDADWLVIGVEGEIDGERWDSASACMMVDDSEGMVEWLEKLVTGIKPRKSYAPTGFEPAFDIGYLGRRGKIYALCIELEPFMAPESADKSERYIIETAISHDDLKRMLEEWKKDAEKFPSRQVDRSKVLVNSVDIWDFGQ